MKVNKIRHKDNSISYATKGVTILKNKEKPEEQTDEGEIDLPEDKLDNTI